MKIIIAGAGEVGTHLSKLLAKENQDIVLMDADEEKLNFATHFEIMTAEGNPTSLKDLEAAGVKDAEMFIAVTPEESTNITACMLATNLGAVKTFARINNYEYLLPKNKEFFQNLGVDSMIYPEMLAAQEIVSTLKKPWARQWWELCDGALILIGVKVRENAPIVNKYLYDISKEDKDYHIVAIKRGNDTIIPRGNDQLLAGDILFFITLKDKINVVKEQTGKKDIQIKKIVIMGGSRIAIKAVEYIPHNIRVKIIEINKEKSYKLAEMVPGNVMIINGDARDTELLVQENVMGCDAFIALTENSETNILACLAAKSMKVSRTIAKVENIDYIPMAEKLDIGTVINKKLIAVDHIYQFLLNADVSNVKSLTFAQADVAELIARPNSKITKKPVKDLKLPKSMTLGGLIRNGDPQLINGDTQIEAHDHVVVFCLNTAMRKIEDYFN
ncbi:MAG: Trk system potassium transporter TrkA [Dysgonamonadaceae bacterium]|jgi:trk system potassium uptake protein TrkA|nr:Trk system potassium transporter TrkA [Dysgonamonadaceae bacterium]